MSIAVSVLTTSRVARTAATWLDRDEARSRQLHIIPSVTSNAMTTLPGEVRSFQGLGLSSIFIEKKRSTGSTNPSIETPVWV